MTKRLAVVLFLLAAITGCDKAGPASGPSWQTPTASVPAQGGSPADTSTGPAGLLTLSMDTTRPDTTRLTVHDSGTGKPVFTATTPGWPFRGDLHRRSFSPDWAMLVWHDYCQIRLAKRTPDGDYQRVGVWQPPGWTSVGSQQSCYASPMFKDGRVWAVQTPGSGGAPGKVVSFDPAVSKSEPREEYPSAELLDTEARPAARIDIRLSGTAQSTGTLVASEQSLVSADVNGSTDTTPSVSYVCPEAIDDQTLFCFARGRQVHGALALLTADRSTKTVTLRQASPRIEGVIQGAFLAPDRKRVAVQTVAGWYLTDLAGGGEPRPLFPQLATHPAEVRFWA